MPNLGSLTPREIASQYADFLNNLLSFGPKAPEVANHIQAGVVEFKAAYTITRDHFVKTEGLKAAAPITIDWESAFTAEPEIAKLESQLASARGVSGGGVEGPREWITFIMQHPELLTFIMSFFKK